MNKRLLAGLMAFCLAAGAANAAFADDPLLQETLHTEIATAETAAPPGPAEEPAGESPAETATPTPVPESGPETEPATPESAVPAAKLMRQAAALQSVTIQDSIASTGELVAAVNGSTDPVEGVTYTWYRSKTGADGSWQQVTGQAVNGSAWNLTTDRPQALNAALDTLLARSSDPAAADMDRYHYRVKVTAGDTTLQADAAVSYYVQLQNGSFEYPLVSSESNAANRFYYPRERQRCHFLQTPDAATDPDIYWYTTTACTRWGDGENGKFIEIADATTTNYTDYVIVGNDPRGKEKWDNSTDANAVSKAYDIGKAYDGGQFAELNCQAYGALYQDVLTVPGATLNWSLAHAGRDGTDTMALLIAPVEAAKAITEKLQDKTTSAAIQQVLAGNITVNGVSVPVSNYIVDGNIVDGSTAWGMHSGTYTVPAGQYVSRFFFVAVASASGNSAEGLKRGNLIDRVWFSTDPVPPAAGSGLLRVTKTLLRADGENLTDAELLQAKEKLHFTVVNSDREIVVDFGGSAMQADATRPNVLQYTMELPLVDSGGSTCRYAVTETERGEPEGYDCTLVRTAGADGMWTEVTDAPVHSGITLTAQSAADVQFENTYARSTGSLTLTKQLPAGADEALQADFAGTVNTFTIESVASGSYSLQYTAGARPADAPDTVSPDADGRLTVPIKGTGSVTLPGLTPGSYTVTESNAPDLTGYYLTTPAPDRTRTAAVTAGGSAEVRFVNTYEPYLSVTITKKVTGNMGDTTKNFAFTATLDTTQIRQGSAYTTAQDGAVLTDTGFTLRSGSSITLTHLRADQTLTLTETDPGGHAVRWQLNGDEGPAGAVYTLQVPQTQPAEITCINTRNVSIPTGLGTHAVPYLVLTGLCWLGWRLLRRREV